MSDHDAMSVDQLDGWAEVHCRCGWTSRGADEEAAREKHSIHHRKPWAAQGITESREAIDRARGKR